MKWRFRLDEWVMLRPQGRQTKPPFVVATDISRYDVYSSAPYTTPAAAQGKEGKKKEVLGWVNYRQTHTLEKGKKTLIFLL